MPEQQRMSQQNNQWKPVKVTPVREKSLRLKKNNGNRKRAEKKNRYNRSRQEWTNRSNNHGPRPEADKEAGTEQQTNEVPLDPFEQSLLDILDEE